MNSSGNKPYFRSFAAIDLNAIEHNIGEIKKAIGSTPLLVAVKADAYGHGAVEVARHIEPMVDYMAVADIEEALELKRNGIKKPVLILSYTAPVFFDALIESDITATIYALDDALALNEAAARCGKKARVHIAVDTGMGRVGFLPSAEGADIVKEICALNGLFVEGLFSHLACADAPDKEDALCQLAEFDRFIGLLEERGVNIPVKHICNSAGSVCFEKKYDMCRAGIVAYGLYPSDSMKDSGLSLIPAMKVFSHVIHIKKVCKGFKIGYGHTYTADRERTIATISIGYADGFNRCLSNKGSVIINGAFAPVVGKVCMDMIMVDITDIDNVAVGDTAIIIGSEGDASIDAEDFGALTDSFNYEVVCNFSKRVKRVYHYGDGNLK